MKLNIEIEITAEGYKSIVKMDGKEIEQREYEYQGGGCTEMISSKGEIEDYDLECIVEDMTDRANDAMYWLRDCEEEDEE